MFRIVILPATAMGEYNNTAATRLQYHFPQGKYNFKRQLEISLKHYYNNRTNKKPMFMPENIMEELYAEFLLWKHGFRSNEKYEELLHKMFLLDYYNDYLLELEENTSNLLNTSGCFLRYWTYENTDLDIHKFGKLLFSGLKDVYYSNTLSIEQFGKCCYSLWLDLPDDPRILSEPFLILSYADDLFLYSYEEQTRRCYEEAFEFFDDEAHESPQ